MTRENSKKTNILLAAIAIASAAVISGCAGGKEFETVPQQGASRTGIYPRFSQKPQGETAQFTKAERDQLANQLVNERNNLERAASDSVPNAQDIARQKQAANAAAAETLRKIEQDGH